MAAGDTQAAIGLCEERLARNKKEAFSYNLIGQIHASKKRYKEAGKAYQSAIDFAPQWEEPSNNLAALYLLQESNG